MYKAFKINPTKSATEAEIKAHAELLKRRFKLTDLRTIPQGNGHAPSVKGEICYIIPEEHEDLISDVQAATIKMWGHKDL